ncbi:S-adenosylmethionine--2-demethylmenaquinone methyltransferase [Pseudomonas cremoricolorata]|uniref:S-adenosylmethionine--2-demethylmenaquinone methyltransferase n=1 Tax=Pseudomonas cremoricolorata TaxID=157783 RepID=UPI00041E3EE3|nr:S-adenosylmethionine--2-demethylmenaquinone methyltransferase [Pseudomonas cremoricolorata]
MNTELYFSLPELIPEDILQRVRKLSPAQLCDGMQGLGIPRNGCMDHDLMPLDESKIMLGTACTVDTEEGDNFPIHVAIYQSQPGYVLVIAGKGYRGRAYLGDLMAGAAQAIGLSGLVIDGCVRDKLPLAELDIPVYAKGFNQRSPAKQGPGKINALVHCAGVDVAPGDLVFGDYDGVTVVPRARLLEVLEASEKKDAYEARRRAVIDEYARCRAQGTPLPELAPAWVTELLDKP